QVRPGGRLPLLGVRLFGVVRAPGVRCSIEPNDPLVAVAVQCGAEGNRRRLVTGAAWRSWSLVTACAVWYYARWRLARRPNSNEAGATVGQRQWQQSACKYR